MGGHRSRARGATPSTGTAPLSVTFDGSASTTPNGTVTSWAWSFGDGASGTGPVTSHVYSTPGTYTASLTVTDSTGASGTATGSIVVNPVLPAAPSGLTASLSGFLIQLAWQDNSSNETLFSIERCVGSGCTNFATFATQYPNVPSYTDYSATAGQSYSYRVRAYNAGGYSAPSNIASIVAGGGNTMLRSTAIDLSATLQGFRVSVSGNVVVKDASGAAVSGAVVSVTWAYPGRGTSPQTATTRSTGIAKFSTTGGHCTYTLTVGNITKTGYSFDAANSMLKNSITK